MCLADAGAASIIIRVATYAVFVRRTFFERLAPRESGLVAFVVKKVPTGALRC